MAREQDTAVAMPRIPAGCTMASSNNPNVSNKKVAPLAFDLLARIKAMRNPQGPLFSALLTLWLSMMAAVGLASRLPRSGNPHKARQQCYRSCCRTVHKSLSSCTVFPGGRFLYCPPLASRAQNIHDPIHNFALVDISVAAAPSGRLGTGKASALDRNESIRQAYEKPTKARGRLKIGDDWNAITIIALSQSSPLKAIAELVENSIDAKARTVTITRGREHGRLFLAIRDDGEGVPRDSEGRPDFRYVATHICDSVKRRLKADGTAGLQGEFGIGLLSFWTVGDELTMTSIGADQRAYQMVMRKGDPSYSVSPKRTLFGEGGTEVRIAPLLDGIRALSGEKIQWYLAAELRDRIRATGVRINVVDRLARKQYAVEPRQYEGRLLHQLPLLRTPLGDIYVELYPERAIRHQLRSALPARHARDRRSHPARSFCAHALEFALSAGPSRCTICQSDAQHTHRDHLRFCLHCLVRGAAAAGGKARRDHRGAAPRRGRTG